MSMVFHMKTTLNSDDHVMRQLREEAARRRTTMSELVEAGLRILANASPGDNGETARPVLPTWRGGGALVDLSNRAELYSAMEEP